eukprot:GHVO01056456.1.p1 GENE.GHVO01056456.1~~GHVO01056456.1.p1  ORF type:complete len:167 (-),score=30.34 GHVO01056456.1:374-874(-)
MKGHTIERFSKDTYTKLRGSIDTYLKEMDDLHELVNTAMDEVTQLKASNDQLKASNDQLKPSNDQLKASNDQLKASNDQLTQFGAVYIRSVLEERLKEAQALLLAPSENEIPKLSNHGTISCREDEQEEYSSYSDWSAPEQDPGYKHGIFNSEDELMGLREEWEGF